MAGTSFDSCTGRAVSIRDDLPAARGGPIAIADPRGWISAGPAGPDVEALAGCRLSIVISAGLDDIVRYNLIKAGIVSVALAPKSMTEIQDAVESDPGILLAVDMDRRDVRARGTVARFDIGGADEMARQLLIAQRLLCSSCLASDDQVRLHRRLVAIGNAAKVPGADVARGAWRIDRLLADIAQARAQLRRPGGTF
jgi:hypothetical protein